MSNPTLNEKTLRDFSNTEFENMGRTLTSSGVVGKTSLLFAVLIAVSAVTFYLAVKGFADKADMLITTGLIGGVITAFFIAFKPHSNYMVPATFVYAIFEGLAVGGITGNYIASSGGMLIAGAVLATFASLISMLFLYKAKIIKCTEKFRSAIFASLTGILILYGIAIISSFFNPTILNIVFGNGLIGLGINIFVCIVAVLCFITDFYQIEYMQQMGVPEKYEWYCGFSLMVTIVWVYLEFLRLLARFERR